MCFRYYLNLCSPHSQGLEYRQQAVLPTLDEPQLSAWLKLSSLHQKLTSLYANEPGSVQMFYTFYTYMKIGTLDCEVNLYWL